MGRAAVVKEVEVPASAPQYELGVRRPGPTDNDCEVWQACHSLQRPMSARQSVWRACTPATSS